MTGGPLTEADIIIDATLAWMKHAGVPVSVFAMDYLEPALRSHGVRDTEFSTLADCFERQSGAFRRQVDRVIKGTYPFNLRWKYAWLSALPVPYRATAMVELRRLSDAFTYGDLSPVFCPHTGVVASRAQPGVIMDVLGRVVTTIEPATDGVYDSKDSVHALNGLRRALEAAQIAMSVEVRSIGIAIGSEVSQAFGLVSQTRTYPPSRATQPCGPGHREGLS